MWFSPRLNGEKVIKQQLVGFWLTLENHVDHEEQSVKIPWKNAEQ